MSAVLASHVKEASGPPAVIVVGSLHYDIMVDAPGPTAEGGDSDRAKLVSEIRRQGRQSGGRGTPSGNRHGNGRGGWGRQFRRGSSGGS